MSEVALPPSFDSASAFCLQFDDACGGSTVLVGVVLFCIFAKTSGPVCDVF